MHLFTCHLYVISHLFCSATEEWGGSWGGTAKTASAKAGKYDSLGGGKSGKSSGGSTGGSGWHKPLSYDDDDDDWYYDDDEDGGYYEDDDDDYDY